MPSKVCLVTSPRFNRKPVRKSQCPLGLAYLAAVARQAGHDVTGVEGVFLGDPAAIAERVAANEPDVVGTSTVTIDRLAGIETIRQIRRRLPKAFLVVGGSHFSNSAADAMEAIPQIDAVVMGEGEVTFLELLERFRDRDSLGEVKGLTFRRGDGQVVRTAPRELMPGLDHLPRPAWELFRPDSYSLKSGRVSRSLENASHIVQAGVVTSRGCPGRCAFCANANRSKVRFVSAAVAVDQVEWLQKTFGVTAVDFLDDDFLSSSRHAIEVCEEILRRNLKISWWADSRAKNLDEDVLALMKRAGCRALAFGVETGTDEVLKTIHKGVTTADMLAAMEVVARVGFQEVETCLILGLPGETLDTVDRTIAYLRQLGAILGDAWHERSLVGQLPLIYPGTELETLGRQEGCLPEKFSWNRPYLEPKRYLPLLNHRYRTVPHFYSRQLPLEKLCAHIRRHYWNELYDGRRKRYLLAPLRRLKVMLGLG